MPVLWSEIAHTKPCVLSVGSTQNATPPSLKSPTAAGYLDFVDTNSP